MNRSIAAFLVAALAFLPGVASAEEPPKDALPPGDAVSDAITPPTPIDAGSVVYPDGSNTDATVVLELTIDAEGHVGGARVVEGEDPFASAAVDAAQGWSFTPAQRAGKAVPARVRFRVDFHAPVPEVPPSSGSPAQGTASPAPAPPGTAAPPPAPLAEVHVRGTVPEVGETRLGGAEVRQLPGAFGDAFRALEALPGVTPVVSGLPFFFVRGAPPGNTGYFVDGVRVPLLFHLALGPSVIHPGLIDHVDFYPGGYPAQFGRYAGGILSGETLPPATHVHAEANIRLFDAGALAEAPMLDGRLTALVAGRYSYTAALVQLFAKDTRVAYWDYQTRLAYKLTPRDTISAFWFGSFDEIDQRDRQSESLNGTLGSGSGTGTTAPGTAMPVGPASPGAPASPAFEGQGTVETVTPFYPLFKTEFHRLDLRYDHETTNGHLRLALTLGIEDSLAGTSQTQQTRVSAKSVELRTEGEERLNPFVKVRYGADVLLYHYTFDSGTPMLDVESLDPDRNDVMVGAYADALWKPTDRVELVPGFRADVFTSRLASPVPQPSIDGMSAPIPGGLSNSTATVGLDPRLAARVSLSRRVTWVTTFGVSHQPPSLVVPIPGLTLGRLNSGLQTSVQTSEGFEFALPLEITVTTTAFLHNYLGLTDATATCLGDSTDTSNVTIDCFAKRVRGRSYGVELLARRDLTKRVSGWVSYTLSRSTRETQGVVVPRQVLPPGFGGGSGPSMPSLSVVPNQGLQEIPSEFDRTHVLNVVAAVDLGAGWRAGARFFYYTGRPYSPQIDGRPVPPYNSLRLPDFYRIDARLEKQWHAFGDGHISLVFEGMNVTLNKEAIGVNCNQQEAAGSYDKCTPQYIGPVSVPSIGIEGAI